MSSHHLAGSTRYAGRCGRCDCTVFTLLRRSMEALVAPHNGQGLSVRSLSTFYRPWTRSSRAWARRLSTRDADVAGQQSLWPACSSFRCILRIAMSGSRSSRRARGTSDRMTSPNLLHRSQSLWQFVLDRSRSSRLSNGQWSREAWKRRHSNAG